MIRVAWPTLGHNWSWDDNQFVLEALSRGGELLKEVLPKGFVDRFFVFRQCSMVTICRLLVTCLN